MILQKFDETSLSQQYKLTRIPKSDGAVKIHSLLYSNKVVGAACALKNVLLYNDGPQLGNHTWWKIGSG